ncbi:MAG: SOS response-associated peptidase, partial [Paracoccaceae bacterium]|nr:SOS response-associated peptidase [Paracoccaceae bacterium]
MCGRFAFTLPNEAMAQLFSAVPGNDLPEGARFNICPTQTIAV